MWKMGDKKPAKNQNEIRTLPIQNLEARGKNNEGTKITGYAAVYDEFTQIYDFWGDYFYERIAAGAMKRTLEAGHDIFALRNHNWDNVVGRTGQNLTLSSDENGLYFDLTPPNTTLGRDVLEEVRGGLVNQCSIGFRVLESDWEFKGDEVFRTITDLELYEITLTPIPAYTSTSAEVRSLKKGILKGEKQPQINKDEQEERRQILAEAERIHQVLKNEGGRW